MIAVRSLAAWNEGFYQQLGQVVDLAWPMKANEAKIDSFTEFYGNLTS